MKTRPFEPECNKQPLYSLLGVSCGRQLWSPCSLSNMCGITRAVKKHLQRRELQLINVQIWSSPCIRRVGCTGFPQNYLALDKVKWHNWTCIGVSCQLMAKPLSCTLRPNKNNSWLQVSDRPVKNMTDLSKIWPTINILLTFPSRDNLFVNSRIYK
jgi:hypothetical protein